MSACEEILWLIRSSLSNINNTFDKLLLQSIEFKKFKAILFSLLKDKNDLENT